LYNLFLPSCCKILIRHVAAAAAAAAATATATATTAAITPVADCYRHRANVSIYAADTYAT